MANLKLKKLTIHDRQLLENFLKDFPPYSDFSFLSLFTYNTNGSVEYAFYKGNLIIRFEDYTSTDSFYSVLGKNTIAETVDLLLVQSQQTGLRPSLHLVPEASIKNAPGLSKRFKVQEDRDNFDYIVSASDIAELSPQKYPKKRKLVDEFKTSYPELKVTPLGLGDRKVQQDILKIFQAWAEQNGKRQDDMAIELAALTRLIGHAHHFPNLHAIGIYDGERLVAFSTFESTHGDYGISSFQKADKNYIGIYAYLTHEMAKMLVAEGRKYINFEQDLGFSGLRSSKSSWHPVEYLKKYSLHAR